MDKIKLKYKLKHYLDQIPIGTFAGELASLALKLDCSTRTLYRWAAIGIDHDAEIPESKLELLRQYFRLESADDLRNYTVKLSNPNENGSR